MIYAMLIILLVIQFIDDVKLDILQDEIKQLKKQR